MIVAIALAACSSATSPSSGATTSTTKTTIPSFGVATPVGNGFGGQEYFCAQQPLRGVIDYDGASGHISMDVQVTGLPAKAFVFVNWLDNTIRGYVIGGFSTGRTGGSTPSSLLLYRPGETRGYQILLTTAATSPVNLGVLWPCGAPPRVPAQTVDNPSVTVTPSEGLVDGQVVRVSVKGFGASGKVWLSECDSAEDANDVGCGPQLAAQPFIITGNDRSGSTDFTVHASAPSKPYDTSSLQPCTRLCVVVAGGAGGAWVVAPIVFGSAATLNS